MLEPKDRKIELLKTILQYSITPILLFLYLLFAGAFDYAEAAGEIGKFTNIEGKVDILRDGRLPAVAAKRGDVVFVKDLIRTKSDSKAEILFADGNLIKIAPRSRIDISEYASEKSAVIRLPAGKVEAVVPPKNAQRIATSPDANRFEVRTITAIGGVRGTQYFVFHDRNVTGILVKQGTVYAYNPKIPKEVVNVTAGTMTTIAQNKPPQPPRPVTQSEMQKHEKDTTPSDKPKDKAEDKPKNESPAPAPAPAPPPAPPVVQLAAPPVAPIALPPPPPITETNTQTLTKKTLGPDSRIQNNSFEGGNTNYWTLSHSNLTAVVASYTHNCTNCTGYTYSPVDGNYFLKLTAGGGTGVYTTASQAVNVESGIVVAGYAAFASADYSPYNDDAYVKILGTEYSATPWSKSTSNVGNYGRTDWIKWTWTAPYTDNYTIELGVRNVQDNILNSNALFDAFASGALANFTKIINGTSYLLGKGFTMLIRPDSPSIWSGNPAYINLLGVYTPGIMRHDVWYGNVHSYNYHNNTATTYNGGAYYGFLGGIKMPAAEPSYDKVEGRFMAVYIDPANSNGISRAGILKGTLTGVAMDIMDIDGAIYRTQMLDNIGITPANLINSISKYSISSNSNTNFMFNGNQMGDAHLRPYSHNAEFSGINGLDWGVWNANTTGSYSGITPSDNFSLSMTHNDVSKIIGMETSGTQWSSNKITGTTAGYWADMNSLINSAPATGIMIGETFGTFDPNDSSFKTVQMGTWVETTKLIAMTTTDSGKAALQQMNIPAFEVGRVTLTGSGNGFTDLKMTDTIFLAPSTGAKPTIWATGNVSGAYTSNPALNSAINVSGGGINADFTFKTWDAANNKWISTINSTGGNNIVNGYNVQFNGAGAGTINNVNKTISGTAAGTVK